MKNERFALIIENDDIEKEGIKEEKFFKDYLLQKELIHRLAATFSFVYHFKEQSIFVEKQFREVLGEEFLEVFAGYPFRIESLILPKNKEEATAFFDVVNKEKLYDEIELKLRIDSVHYEWFKITTLIHCCGDGSRECVAFLFTNIEKEIEAKEKLTFMAVNDPLTHIPNVRTFAENVQGMIEKYPGETFQMITMDIRQFRLVNKLFGYAEGDGVLKYLATKLQEIIESYEKGVYCRMASDIYYACFSEKEDTQEFLETLREEMKNYPLKFELKLSFGIYSITNLEESVETMIEHASYARLEVKKSLAQSVQYYNEKLREKEYFETVVTSEMEHALRHGQFEVYYQPKCDPITNQIVGSEALVRWNNPKMGFLSPGIFIPIFEQNGFIAELDFYVYEEICKELRNLLDQGKKVVPVSANVSRCDLYDNTLFERILKMVDRYDIPHELIEFEITESAFILESKLLSEFTEKLRKKGFCVLIDDFGSGYSSLNSLKNIKTDVLKIDIAFLPVTSEEMKSPIILTSVIEMAKRLGLATIAEGVETQEQLELLKRLGCGSVQGYYCYRPMPVTEYRKLLED